MAFDSGALGGDDTYGGNGPNSKPVPVSNTGAPQNTAPPAATPATVVQKVPVPDHHSLLGRAFRSLYESMGQGPPSYHIDPQSGQAVRDADKTPTKPGQFFRNILAASILGAQSGMEAQHKEPYGAGPAQSMIAGAAGVRNDAQSQDDAARRTAEDDWKRAQLIKQQKLAEQKAQTEIDRDKALTAEANANTARINKETQGSDFRMHQEVATAGKASIQPYIEAGLQPVFDNVSESDMTNLIKTRPDAAVLDWEHTGVRTTIDKNGVPQYEYTFTAFDPNGKIKLTPGVLDQWKKDGLDKFYPELSGYKPGRELTVQQYIQLKRLDEGLFADNIKRTKDRLEVEEKHAQIEKTQLEIGKLRLEKKEKDELDKAQQELASLNGDISNLSPDSRRVLSKYSQTMVKEFNDSIGKAYEIYKGAVQAAGGMESDEAKQALQEIQTLQGARDMWLKIGGAGTPTAQTAQPGAEPKPQLGEKGSGALVQPVVLAHIISRAHAYGTTPEAATKIQEDLNAIQSVAGRRDYINKLQVSPAMKAELLDKVKTVTPEPKPQQVTVVTAGGKTGTVSKDQLESFLRDNPGSAVLQP